MPKPKVLITGASGLIGRLTEEVQVSGGSAGVRNRFRGLFMTRGRRGPSIAEWEDHTDPMLNQARCVLKENGS